ncbi:MAG: hypothetical protein OXI56_07025 [bacterium]|nr:hypothetical protein [bacterium]MDE0601531.1 hypothetical protein [bacterium]
MHPPPPPTNRLERWQRNLLVTLGTLVVIMAVTAVVLVIRNALGSSGLTGGPTGADTTTVTAGATTLSQSPGTEPTRPETNPVPETSLPETTLPPATFVEDPIVAADLYLQPEGLGPLPFGSDAERTVAVLTGALGNPDNDTGWVPADLDFLRCPGVRARVVNWGSLTVYLSDGPTEWGPDGHEHLFSFTYSLLEGQSLPAGPELRTSEGLRLGTTLSRASSIYGQAAISHSDTPVPPDEASEEVVVAQEAVLEVDVPGPGYLTGTFSGPGPDDTLVSISGGTGCEE